MHACMHVCMHVMYACNVCMYVCNVCKYVMLCYVMYVCMYVCICLCIYLCIYVCMYVSMYLCIYVSMYLCIYVSMYVNYTMYVDIYIEFSDASLLFALQFAAFIPDCSRYHSCCRRCMRNVQVHVESLVGGGIQMIPCLYQNLAPPKNRWFIIISCFNH